jgi:DNA excision repair protein ERCC-3
MATEHKPLIVQGDRTLMLDVHSPGAEECRVDVGPFAELEKSPEHFHTYRLTSLSLWNAASAGLDVNDILGRLDRWSRFPVPEFVKEFVTDRLERYGSVRLVPGDSDDRLILHVDEDAVRLEFAHTKRLQRYLAAVDGGFAIDLVDRGTVKQLLMELGYPVQDEVPLRPGAPLDVPLRDVTADGYDFAVRDYQTEAAEVFMGGGRPGNGYGTVVLPCGAGKTIVGMAVMQAAATNTLILTTNVAAVHQWRDELLDKTYLTVEDIGEYTGNRKDIKPITIGTYQILTWRPEKGGPFPHFDLFRQREWGLIIYDEVHLLPAPVFRVTAEIQAVRRLGLTATLVREDGRERDVFSLVGPKRYDVPWKELEGKGWIAEALCQEIRVDLPEDTKIDYAVADKRKKYRIAAENSRKLPITEQLVANHREDAILVIGQYLDQLHILAKHLEAPIITGRTPNAEREEIYGAFRRGEIRVLVVSKVANFAIDLPDASVAIQVSGSFGSRQEEAQRLGRILRPKKKNSYFYSLVSRHSAEEEFASHRQKFLTEQGYKYHIEYWDD